MPTALVIDLPGVLVDRYNAKVDMPPVVVSAFAKARPSFYPGEAAAPAVTTAYARVFGSSLHAGGSADERLHARARSAEHVTKRPSGR